MPQIDIATFYTILSLMFAVFAVGYLIVSSVVIPPAVDKIKLSAYTKGATAHLEAANSTTQATIYAMPSVTTNLP